MKKEESDKALIDILIAEAIIQVRAMENLLVAKGLITKEEVDDEMLKITAQVSKKILEHAKVAGDLDEILKEFNPSKDKN